MSWVASALISAQMWLGEITRPRPHKTTFEEFKASNQPSEIRPIVYAGGTVELTPSRIWYGDFHQRAVERDSHWTDYLWAGPFAFLLDTITVAYRYYCGELFSLCYGPDAHVEYITIDERPVYAPVIGTNNAGGGFLIDDPQAWGGDQPPGEGGEYAWCDVTRGNYIDPTNAYLESVLTAPPNKTPSLRGISCLVVRGFSGFRESGYFAAGGVGFIPRFREWKVRIRRQPDNLATGFGVLGRHMNAAEVLYEWSTNLEYGAAAPVEELNIPSFQQVASDLYDEYQQGASAGCWSGKVESQTHPVDVVTNVLQQIDGVLDPSPSLGMTLRLIRRDYTFGTLRHLNQSNVTAVDRFTPGTYEDTVNKIIVPYKDIENNSADRPAVYVDPANQQIQGGRLVPQTQEYLGVADSSTGNLVATRDGRSQSIPRAPLTCSVLPTFGKLTYRGEVLIFNWTSPTFTRVMRVLAITPGNAHSTDYQLALIEDQFAIGFRTFGEPSDTQWIDPGAGLDTAPPDAAWDTGVAACGLLQTTVTTNTNQFSSVIEGHIIFDTYTPGGQYGRIWVTEPSGVQTLSPVYLAPDADNKASFTWPATAVGTYEFCVQTYSLRGITNGDKVCCSIDIAAMGTPSLSPSASVSPSASQSPSVSPSASTSPSGSVSPSSSASPSVSASVSPSHSQSPSGSQSPSSSTSPSASTSPSSSASPSSPAGPPTTNLELWLDASQETGFSDDDTMSTVQDWSGNNRDGTGGGTLNPRWRSSLGPNSLPAFEWDENGSGSSYFGFSNFLTGFTAGHGFAVVKNYFADGSSPPFSQWGTATDGYYPFGNGHIYDTTGTNARKDNIDPVISLQNWHVYEFRSASGSWQLYLNGVQRYTTASNTVAFTSSPQIGREGATTRVQVGLTAEQFFYSSIQSGTDLQAIYDYLEAKYGITMP